MHLAGSKVSVPAGEKASSNGGAFLSEEIPSIKEKRALAWIQLSACFDKSQ